MGNVCPAPLPRLEDLFRDYAEAQRAKREAEARKRAEAEKDLFLKGPTDGTAVHPSDVIQGQHANCFLVAAMAAVARQHPDPDAWMRNAIKVNADGTYTVTFYDKQADGSFKPRTETVSGDFNKPAHSDEKGEKWPAVMEKAYAQAYGDKTEKPYGFGSSGGLSTEAMERLTGKASQYTPMENLTLNQLAAFQWGGQAVTVSSHDKGLGPVYDDLNSRPGYTGNDYTGRNLGHPDVTPWHVYHIAAVDPGLGMVKVHNVWDGGSQEINMPFDDFQKAFRGVHVNPVQ